MNKRATPETDAVWADKSKNILEHARRLECERDEARYGLQENSKINKITMNNTQLKEIREFAYGMSVANLNPEDVEDYMAIASACARMESRRAAQQAIFSHQETKEIEK